MTVNDSKIVVYLDMDGPLCDFMKDIKGCKSNADGDPLPMLEAGFFRNLDPTEGALAAVDKLLKSDVFDVFICTYPTSKALGCASEKMEWINEHIPALVKRMLLVCDKGLVIGDYLIDDSPRFWKDKFKGTFLHFDDQRPAESWMNMLEVLSKHDPKLMER